MAAAGGGDGTMGTERALADDDSDTPRVLDPAAERALVAKLDFRLLPVLAVMYLFNALDKANLGNAKTNGVRAVAGPGGRPVQHCAQRLLRALRADGAVPWASPASATARTACCRP